MNLIEGAQYIIELGTDTLFLRYLEKQDGKLIFLEESTGKTLDFDEAFVKYFEDWSEE